MANLGTPTATADIIRKYGIRFQKKYGQNFLIDANILGKIMDCAEVSKEDFVIEIGPGIGTMTQYLAERAGKVAAVEVDRNLIPVLRDTLSAYQNVRIIHDDILKTDIEKLVKEENNGKPVKVVANLPYYITTPIIMGLFESHVPLSSVTIMVQKEVADRMKAGPGTKDYGVLSLAVQYYAQPEIMLQVPPSCFMPRPTVGSTVIRLTRFEKPPAEVQNEEKLFAVIRAAFNQRRKTLANALANALVSSGLQGDVKNVSRQQVCRALEQMGLSQTIRGEALTLAQFVQLADLL